MCQKPVFVPVCPAIHRFTILIAKREARQPNRVALSLAYLSNARAFLAPSPSNSLWLLGALGVRL